MPAGRPRKPAALRIAEGNRGHRPIPREPEVDDTMPVRPKHLVPMARAKWDQLAPRLHAAGLLKAVDADALAAYCETYAMWRKAHEFCAKHGPTMPTTNSAGALVTAKRPEFEIAQKCLDQMAKMMRQFGLSPAARANLGAASAPKDEDPFSKAMGA